MKDFLDSKDLKHFKKSIVQMGLQDFALHEQIHLKVIFVFL